MPAVAEDKFIDPHTAGMLDEHYNLQADAADQSEPIDEDRWESYLSQLRPDLDVRLHLDRERQINRGTLWQLADASRNNPADDRALAELFWNIMAWGISGTWRNVQGVMNGFINDRPLVMEKLREAQSASYEGRLEVAYASLDRLILHWGSAFMTKFLAFTANRELDGRPKALTIDARVQLAWKLLIGEDGARGLNARRYQTVCVNAAKIAAASGWTPDGFEQRMFLFGRTADSHDKWAVTQLTLLQDRHVQLPSPSETLQRLREGRDRQLKRPARSTEGEPK